MSLKQAKSDEFYCESVAKSISDIIRFSLDEEFRISSFKLFNVSSTNETEKEIRNKLISILENKSTSRQDKNSKKRRKKSTEETEKEMKEKQDSLDGKYINQTSDTLASNNSNSTESNLLPLKFFEKNWLHISSQQYRHAVKRRKLNYFSQPQFSRLYESHSEFSHSELYLSYSQPTTSVSTACSLYNNAVEVSYEVPDNNSEFCRKMFEASFKNNAKYLKKNLRTHKQFKF